MPRDDDLQPTRNLSSAPGATPAEGSLAPGSLIGRYRIEALLGSGGMGEVYRAVQLEPVRRTVALKLMHGQRLQARERAWFEVERQLLAQMRHPAIAQIHDAGTTDEGVPYFAMEYIDGAPLTRWCTEHALSLDERIALLVRVCEGVGHAHQKGVVHRDLKPGNILVAEVDGRPLPKIIDFGIATASSRARAAGSLLAEEGDRAGTPEYMSPEQASVGTATVDTRSDIYSLGVILYELLTGHRPGAANTDAAADPALSTLRPPSAKLATMPADEATRLARTQGLPLSGLQRTLRHELDWVVLKAMQRERGDRYASVGELADDLRRYREQRPLQAVPATRRYLAGKFVRRHRLPLATAAVVLLALLGGLGVSLWGLHEARTQRALAEARQAELEKVVDFQQSMLEDIDLESMGRGLGEGLQAQLAGAPAADRAALAHALGQASPTDLARKLLERHLLAGAEEAITRDFQAEPALAMQLLESVAQVRHALGLYDAAAQDFTRIVDWRGAHLGKSAPETLRARLGQATALRNAGHLEQARELLESALADAAALPPTGELRVKLELGRSVAVAALGDRATAREQEEALLARVVAAHGEKDPRTLSVRNNLGITLAQMGEYATARTHFEQLVALRTQLLGAEHEDTLTSATNLAALRALDGDLEGALELQQRLVEARIRRLGARHSQTLKERNNLAATLIRLGRGEEALPDLRAVAAARLDLFGADHPQTMRVQVNLASLLARLERYDESLALQKVVVASRTRVLGAQHPDTLTIRVNLASTLEQAGQPRQALPIALEAWAARREVLGGEHPDVAVAASVAGDIQLELGKVDGAIEAFDAALAVNEVALGADNPTTALSAWRLAGALDVAGTRERAQRVRRQYVAPLLAMEPEQRSPEQQRAIERMREEDGEAGAGAVGAGAVGAGSG